MARVIAAHATQRRIGTEDVVEITYDLDDVPTDDDLGQVHRLDGPDPDVDAILNLFGVFMWDLELSQTYPESVIWKIPESLAVDGTEFHFAISWNDLVDTDTVATSITYRTFIGDQRIHTATLLVAAKLWERRNSPIGIVGGFDTGPANVRGVDPDVEQLLVGLRVGADLSTQSFPTVDELRTHSGIGSTHTDATLQTYLDAAIAIVSRKVAGRGIA